MPIVRNLAVLPLTLAAALLAAGTAFAQGPPSGDQPDGTLDAAARAAVIDAFITALEKEYVFPETAARMADDLRARRDAGEYDRVTSAREFARMLTEHTRAISKDGHLNVNYSHEPVDAPPPGEASGLSPEQLAEIAEFAARVNFGFEKVERLEGNVGYLDLRGFMPTVIAGETAAAAMTFLSRCDAVIIDLRANGGGEPAMVAFLTSYLFDDEPIHLNDLYDRPSDATHQWWTLPFVPGRRLGAKKPVYVLTSRRTFSAAEEFTYNLKNLKRATIVGETTGGGAHPGTFRRLGEHFVAFIPSGRAINPVSGTNWEGTGVAPDIAVPANQALKTAQIAALQAVRDAAQAGPRPLDPATVREFQKTIERLKRELEPTGAKDETR